MFDDMRDLYQEVIMDHNRSPRNFGNLKGATASVPGNNPLCGDQLTVHVKTDGDQVTDITFEGMGCAISKASASLMTETIKGRDLAEARTLYENFHALVTRDGEVDEEALGKLKVFSGVGEFPARVKCATLAWRTMVAAIEGQKEEVTTE